MKKLKYVLIGGLFLLTLPQVFAVGDTQALGHASSTGSNAENISDYYAASVPFLSPW